MSAGGKLEFVFLVAIIFEKDSKPEAWVLDRLRDRTTKLRKGERFKINGRICSLEKIDKDSLILTMDDARLKWPLGKSLFGAELIAKKATAADKPEKKNF